MSEMKYSEALAELEEIVETIENESPDPDELILKVKRAAELIQFCRKRLLNTETEINKVLGKLSAMTDNENE
ncbi:MAG: exodeoxyribonuclease VII small subunit [Bacteroidetes bacterium HGW-Bacteroidetes-6]|jgi:exodeoxyribonuclease VII small subunit|nr:MAG: exodeoxyribonuclease VII small subunit [Bacteroidetes bacterium HGW-Bacteroidetes-6]